MTSTAVQYKLDHLRAENEAVWCVALVDVHILLEINPGLICAFEDKEVGKVVPCEIFPQLISYLARVCEVEDWQDARDVFYTNFHEDFREYLTLLASSTENLPIKEELELAALPRQYFLMLTFECIRGREGGGSHPKAFVDRITDLVAYLALDKELDDGSTTVATSLIQASFEKSVDDYMDAFNEAFSAWKIDCV